MKDFFKYIAAGEDDKEWGLFLNVAGKSQIEPNTAYPPAGHPTGYYFNWENGRVLLEYQVNYITEGFGILETKNGSFPIKPGTLMIIRPGVWHRYKPYANTGWTENYIGFNGKLANHFLKKNLLLKDKEIIKCEIREEFIDTYYKIFNLVQNEEPGFQQIASGLIIKLLGYIIAFQKQREFTGKKIEKIIQTIRFLIRDKVEKDLDFEKISDSYNIGYSYFRKMFKKYVGIAPHQYHLELKIMRAKEIILNSDKSIKEICFELGFQSIHYFSRVFKSKVGISPGELRKNNIINTDIIS